MTFRSVDPLEAAQADFLVCMRVTDLIPISSLPPQVQPLARESRQNSTRLPCESFGEPILVGNDAPPGPKRVCTYCHQGVKRVAERMFGRQS